MLIQIEAVEVVFVVELLFFGYRQPKTDDPDSERDSFYTHFDRKRMLRFYSRTSKFPSSSLEMTNL